MNNNSKLGFIAAPVPLVIASPAFTFIPTLPSANCAKNDDSAMLAGVPLANSLFCKSFTIWFISFPKASVNPRRLLLPSAPCIALKPLKNAAASTAVSYTHLRAHETQ